MSYTAKPFIERWIKEQKGFRKFTRLAFKEWQKAGEAVIKTPGLLAEVVQHVRFQQQKKTLQSQKKVTSLLRPKVKYFMLGIITTLIIKELVAYYHIVNF